MISSGRRSVPVDRRTSMKTAIGPAVDADSIARTSRVGVPVQLTVRALQLSPVSSTRHGATVRIMVDCVGSNLPHAIRRNRSLLEERQDRTLSSRSLISKSSQITWNSSTIAEACVPHCLVAFVRPCVRMGILP